MSEPRAPHLRLSDGRRVAVIGDVSGHLDTLREELRRLGANADGRLPDDLVVVQVGDLVHRGPDSDQLVELVDDYLSDQPDNWIQLVGNHEAIYLGLTSFQWPQRLSRQAVRTVRRWFHTGTMVGAAAIHGADESFLVTHAGLTGRFWHDVLGGPTDVDEAADRLTALALDKPTVYARPGHLLGGRLNLGAGPLWASASSELLPSWRGADLPFSQVHGHGSPINWSSDDLRTRSPAAHHPVLIDPVAKHTSVELPGGRIIGLDPEHGRLHPRQRWQAWLAPDPIPPNLDRRSTSPSSAVDP